MTDDELLGMSEAQIRARYRHAPGYYLQAKLERQRALEGRRPAPAPGGPAARSQPAERTATAAAGAPPTEPARRRGNAREPAGVDVALPAFEMLDAALSGTDGSTATPEVPEASPREPTRQAIQETALEDYSNWPLIGTGGAPDEPAPRACAHAASEFERTPAAVLEAEPDVELVLESDREPERRGPSDVPDNVTLGAFGASEPGKVRVVSVAMDRKRPYMVRVIGETTRRAS